MLLQSLIIIMESCYIIFDHYSKELDRAQAETPLANSICTFLKMMYQKKKISFRREHDFLRLILATTRARTTIMSRWYLPSARYYSGQDDYAIVVTDAQPAGAFKNLVLSPQTLLILIGSFFSCIM